MELMGGLEFTLQQYRSLHAVNETANSAGYR